MAYFINKQFFMRENQKNYNRNQNKDIFCNDNNEWNEINDKHIR